MIKFYCDSCKKEVKEPTPIQVELFDIRNTRTNLTQHERYKIDLCEECLNKVKLLLISTDVEPTVNPYG